MGCHKTESIERAAAIKSLVKVTPVRWDLSNNVRGQLVFDRVNAVLDCQFFLLVALD